MIEKEKNIVDYLVESAQKYPERVAVEDCEGKLTYRELDDQSNILAHMLYEHAANQAVLVILPRRSSFLVATFATLKAGGCYVGCNTDYPADRIRYIAEDCGSSTIITTSALWDKRGGELEPLVKDGRELVFINQIDWGAGDASPVNHTSWEQESFMLYTSGTTGKPKGVVHTIRSMTRILLPFAEWDASRATPVREAVFGDMAFAASLPDLFAPCFTGGTVCIIDEETRLDLNRMAAYINERSINRMFMGSSLGVAMMRQYDLHLDQLLLGGEKVTGVTPDMVEHTDMINYYGSSEGFPLAMHHITGHEEVIPVGTQCDGDIIYILDQEMRPVPQGQMGEIYYSSDRIAKCYKNLPEQSAEHFLDDPFRPGWKMLRICDLGYFDENGELVHCGRTDNMFKIHGQRVEPGEVENVAQQFKGMGLCACCKKEINGAEHICLFFEASEKIDTDALRAFMSRQLAKYMVPSLFVQMESLPRNARGKIERKALTPPDRTTLTAEYVAPTSEVEAALCDIMAKVMGLERVGIDDNFRQLGGDSIQMMSMQQLCADSGLESLKNISTDIIYQGATPRVMAEMLEAAKPKVKPQMDDYPLNDEQKKVYFYPNLEREIDMRYNVPIMYQIDEHIDLDRLVDAIKTAFHAHKALFSRFFFDAEGQPRQKMVEESFDIPIERMTEEEFETVKKNLVQPFHLLKDRLFRVRLFEVNTKHFLFLDFHHILYDGTSSQILMRDIDRAYCGLPIEDEDWNMGELAAEENELRQSDRYAQSLQWCKDTFSNGKSIKGAWPEGLMDNVFVPLSIGYDEVENFCQREKETVNAFTTAAYLLMLGTYSDLDDLTINSVFSGRTDSRIRNSVGLFVRHILVRAKWNPEMLCSDYIHNVGKLLMDSMSHSVVHPYNLKDTVKTASNFEFLYQGEMVKTPMIDGFPLALANLEDLVMEKHGTELLSHVYVMGENNTMMMLCSYSKQWHDKDYVLRMVDRYTATLRGLMTARTVGEAQCEVPEEDKFFVF